MGINIDLPYNYTPRHYQAPVYQAFVNDEYKRGVAIWHRRAGKDKTLLNIIVVKSQQRVGSYYYFYPELKQAKKAIWDGMDKSGFKFLNHIPEQLIWRKNEAELKIIFKNGSIFQLVGSDRIDSVMGTNPIGCVFSEYSLQNPAGWDFVRPILRENGGWALFNYTPRGKNHGYSLYEMAKGNPNWFCQRLTIRDTGVLNEYDMDEERAAGMDEDLLQQEFYCSFEASNPGAYFAKQMAAALQEGRICRVPIEVDTPVNTYWDLGINDSNTIWFSQTIGSEVRCLHYYANSGEGLAHYVNYLRDWRDTHPGVVLGEAVLPHDGKKRELGTGKSIQDTLYDLGLRTTVVKRPATKEDGIEASRRLIPKCWFDEEHCGMGIECLRQYRKEFDEVNGIFKARPVHDKFSHGADAFQTMALGLAMPSRFSGWTPHR